jgi:hypothetical protein
MRSNEARAHSARYRSMMDRLCALCVLIGCSAPAPVSEPREQVCTLIGCTDGFTIVTDEHDRGIVVDEHTHVLGSIDGVAFECKVVPPDPEKTCGGQRRLHCDDAAIEVYDMGDDSSGVCVQRLRNLLFTGGPKAVDVTFEIGGASTHRMFHPKYRAEHLNGSDCGVTCTRADEYIF